jgi:hypothetical protein
MLKTGHSLTITSKKELDKFIIDLVKHENKYGTNYEYIDLSFSNITPTKKFYDVIEKITTKNYSVHFQFTAAKAVYVFLLLTKLF